MIYCISDLHLCDKGPRDLFWNRGEDRFYRFLDFVDNNQLYILGDLMDWWQCNLGESVMKYQRLLRRLENMHTTYVWGNHDNAFVSLSGDYELNIPTIKFGGGTFTRNIGGKVFAFLHGHEADSYCRDLNPGIGEITAIISGLLEDRNKSPVRNGKPIEDMFINTLEVALDLWRHLSHQAKRRDEMLDQVEKYRQDRAADVVVLGHTHEQGRIGSQHYNCGSWCRDRDGFTKIEDDGTVSMWTWAGDHAEPFDGVLR